LKEQKAKFRITVKDKEKIESTDLEVLDTKSKFSKFCHELLDSDDNR
jgi:hypothetical protein